MNRIDLKLANGAAGTTAWRPAAIAGAEIALIQAADAAPILPGLDLWDSWPICQFQIDSIHAPVPATSPPVLSIIMESSAPFGGW